MNLSTTDAITIDCPDLSVPDVVDVARGLRQVVLGASAREAMTSSRRVVEDLMARGETVYGVTTGFGKFANEVINEADVDRLQENLVMSHSVGVGDPLPTDVTRAMMLLRVAALARGYSGIRVETVQLMVDMLNRGVTPVIPSKGSVGASGDLAPLAHLALVLIGRGEAVVNGQALPGAVALNAVGLSPISLRAKEGLALVNGTQLMTSLGTLLAHDADRVLKTADVAGAMTLEAVRGTNRAFDPRIQRVRPHLGQIEVAKHLMRLTANSEMMMSHRHETHKVQDAYSLRCMPQVHGASRDAVRYLRQVMKTEINSANDNPLIFADDGDVISGGNFHGQPLALALDFAAIGLAEMANVSERRIQAMLDPHFSELPPFLTRQGGLNSGLMVSQYTAAALVSENKVLAHPASVDSIPTSANQEDHVSMGVTAGLKARQILENVERVLAIEFLCAPVGFDFRRPLTSSPALEAVYALIREIVPPVDWDRPFYSDIDTLTELVRSGRILEATADTAVA